MKCSRLCTAAQAIDKILEILVPQERQVHLLNTVWLPNVPPFCKRMCNYDKKWNNLQCNLKVFNKGLEWTGLVQDKDR
jgi:hypothetical protein